MNRQTAPTPMRHVATAKGVKPASASMASRPKTGKSPKHNCTAARAHSPAPTPPAPAVGSGAGASPRAAADVDGDAAAGMGAGG